METLITAVGLAGAGLWLAVLVLPGRPWGTREHLEAPDRPGGARLGDVTAVIPARDEAETIAGAVRSLRAQGEGLRIVVIDDGSTDGTGELARQAGGEDVEVVRVESLPEGWQGKLWALEQGTKRVRTRYLLLMDADIELAPGLLPALREKLREGGYGLVSLMAELRMVAFWERLLLPAFVFFFKLLYPFDRVARPDSRMAAAAGGCILMKTQALRAIGGFGALQGAIIDDCTLAKRIKERGYGLWLGLTRSARSRRTYPGLSGIWAMVTRTAFSQLHYSAALLVAGSVLMAVAFWGPLLDLPAGTGGQRAAGAVGLAAMALAYAPTLRFYGFRSWRALALPLAGTLFLAMTWASAWRYVRGVRSRWKGRTYGRGMEAG